MEGQKRDKLEERCQKWPPEISATEKQQKSQTNTAAMVKNF